MIVYSFACTLVSYRKSKALLTKILVQQLYWLNENRTIWYRTRKMSCLSYRINFARPVLIGSWKLCTNNQIIVRLLWKLYFLYDFLIVCTRLEDRSVHSYQCCLALYIPFCLQVFATGQWVWQTTFLTNSGDIHASIQVCIWFIFWD